MTSPNLGPSTQAYSRFVWLMGPTNVPAGWRCGMLDAGAQCVMTTGTCGIVLWPAGSWAVDGSDLVWAKPIMAQGPGPSGWMTWDARGLRPL